MDVVVSETSRVQGCVHNGICMTGATKEQASAEVSRRETKGLMKQVRVAVKHKHTPEGTVRIVLDGFSGRSASGA
ncbi:MAG: hypothetical protein PHV74_16020 [Dehalococcoidia bacterium]|nr:hypothetical protein [Dehalococcoidia bacterium]